MGHILSKNSARTQKIIADFLKDLFSGAEPTQEIPSEIVNTQIQPVKYT